LPSEIAIELRTTDEKSARVHNIVRRPEADGYPGGLRPPEAPIARATTGFLQLRGAPALEKQLVVASLATSLKAAKTPPKKSA
jgi:hypothetical protein